MGVSKSPFADRPTVLSVIDHILAEVFARLQSRTVLKHIKKSAGFVPGATDRMNFAQKS
jgi:hypothetical protein